MIADARFRLVKAADVWSVEEGWELLFYYNIYHFCLAFILLVLAAPGWERIAAGLDDAAVATAIAGFLVVSGAAFVTIKRRTPAIHIQAHTLFLLDFLLISILAFSRQIGDANILVLYITTAGATAVIFRTNIALIYAFIATLAVYFRDLAGIVSGIDDLQRLHLSALTATCLFAIVFIVSRVARRTRAVRAALEQQEMELADLDAINHLIIDQLEIGTLFIDNSLGVKLINKQASALVGEYITRDIAPGRLGEALKKLSAPPEDQSLAFLQGTSTLTLRKTEMQTGIMVRIEDQTAIERRLQEAKLAIVGRFASAVAHEIRNPLAAISQAAQLITASREDQESRQLIDIIRRHAKRIDAIIESILEKSRPDKVEAQLLALPDWLHNFAQLFRQSVHSDKLELRVTGQPCTVYFDQIQLEQILTNICENSVHHGRTAHRRLEIVLHVSRNQHGAALCLDISNNGPRIPEHQVRRLFEPFYTTDSASTGLGLFLVREFCKLNGADITYFNEIKQHGFRITFQPENNRQT